MKHILIVFRQADTIVELDGSSPVDWSPLNSSPLAPKLGFQVHIVYALLAMYAMSYG